MASDDIWERAFPGEEDSHIGFGSGSSSNIQVAVAAPGGRTLAVQSSPYHVQLLHMFLERKFQNTDVEGNCRAVLEDRQRSKTN